MYLVSNLPPTPRRHFPSDTVNKNHRLMTVIGDKWFPKAPRGENLNKTKRWQRAESKALVEDSDSVVHGYFDTTF